MLESLITANTHIRILFKFFKNTVNLGHLHGSAEDMNESTISSCKELNNLSEAGFREKEAIQNRISYKANTNHPLFATLQKNSFPAFGTRAIELIILERMGEINIAGISNYANRNDSGT